VSLAVRFVMPRLAAGVTPADSDARAWAQLTTALWAHEREHGIIAMRAAMEGADIMRRFRAPSCAGLSMQVDELMQSVMERYLDEERRYDERSRPVGIQAGGTPPV
jgi:predicted secreted Zn-dependent protease